MGDGDGDGYPAGDGDGDGDGPGAPVEVCGDGIVGPSESCDDGNLDEDDGCTSECAFPSCGDGFLQQAEVCDDGNAHDDDGCDADCAASSVVSLALGHDFSCALTRAGRVRCWGANDDGQLGIGTSDAILDSTLAAPVALTDVVQISAYDRHACALMADNTVACWGRGYYGALGTGSTQDLGDDEPVAAGVDVGFEVASVHAGGRHTCVRGTAGEVRCWGSNESGQLGTPFIDSSLDTTGADVALPGPAVLLATGERHTCVVTQQPTGVTGACFGLGEDGLLANASTENLGDDEVPVQPGFSGVAPYDRLSANSRHSCGLMSAGDVRCWGLGSFGRLGLGHEETIGDDEWGGVPVPLGAAEIADVQTLDRSTCVRTETGLVHCWGLNNRGQLGRGHVETIGDDELGASPGAVDLGFPAEQIATGRDHACALGAGGELRCWGANERGQLGLGHLEDIGDDEPVSAAPLVVVVAV
jgi:cysteine-rich repeat protein